MLVLSIFLSLLPPHFLLRLLLHSQHLQANRLVCGLVCHRMCLCRSILICLTDVFCYCCCVWCSSNCCCCVLMCWTGFVFLLHASLRAWSSLFRRCLISSSQLAGLWLCPMYGPCTSPGATWCTC